MAKQSRIYATDGIQFFTTTRAVQCRQALYFGLHTNDPALPFERAEDVTALLQLGSR